VSVNRTAETFRATLRHIAWMPAALLLTWPAFYNRYPLLFPDSMSYLESGPRVARALFLRQYSGYYGIRSFIYALGIAPLHCHAILWPVIALQATLTAYILWLVVQSFAPSLDTHRKNGCPTFAPRFSALRWESDSPSLTVISYYAIITPLALLTGLGWVTSIVMPDVLGALLYLAIYLLIFAPETLSRYQRVLLFLIAWWSAAAHITHIMLALGLVLFLLASLIVCRAATRRRLWGLAAAASIVLAAILSHMAVHGVLYGKPTLNGVRPAYLTARLIADGPGRWYLQQHCPQAPFAMCAFVQNLPANPDDFLWDSNGLWQTASPQTRALILRQESSFAAAVLRTYPRQQLAISLAAFRQQLTNFDISNDANVWMLEEFALALPGQRPLYERSRQAQDALPNDLLSTIQNWTVAASLALLCLLAPFVWRRCSVRLIGLAAIIFAILLANAFVTAVLAEVDDRYQNRVIWLLPLLAALTIVELLTQRRTREAAPGAVALPCPLCNL
jgi:hypothetical protein